MLRTVNSHFLNSASVHCTPCASLQTPAQHNTLDFIDMQNTAGHTCCTSVLLAVRLCLYIYFVLNTYISTPDPVSTTIETRIIMDNYFDQLEYYQPMVYMDSHLGYEPYNPSQVPAQAPYGQKIQIQPYPTYPTEQNFNFDYGLPASVALGSSVSLTTAGSLSSFENETSLISSGLVSSPQLLLLPDPISPTTAESAFGYALPNSTPMHHTAKNPKMPVLASNASSSKKTTRTSQPGPIPASPPTLLYDATIGRELVTFSYSKQKIISKWTIKCPRPGEKEAIFAQLDEKFMRDNCIYKRAIEGGDYRSSRKNYEKSCNELGWQLCWLNPELRNSKGLLQRAVDSWRNTREDEKVRSRRVRRETKRK